MRLTKSSCFFCSSALALALKLITGQQVLGVGEHLLLDHRAQLLVAGPHRVLAGVVGAGPQHEVDDLVAEVLRVGQAGRLLDLLEFGVERRAVEDLAGVGVAELLVLDPEVGVRDVAVEDVLAVFGVRLEVRRLDFLADEFRVAGDRCSLMYDRYFCSVSGGNCSRSICCSSTYIRCTGLAATSLESKLKTLDRILNAKRVEMPVMPSSTPA
jgi:hypothetical protein